MAIYYPDVDGDLNCSKLSNNFREVLKRANHTGFQSATTIYDLYTAVSNYDFINNLEASVITINTAINDLRNDLFGSGQLSQLIASLQQELADLVSNIDIAISSSTVITGLIGSNAQNEVDIQNLQDLTVILQDSIDNLLDRVYDVEGTLASQAATITDLDTLTGTHTSTLATHTSTLGTVQSTLVTLQANLTALTLTVNTTISQGLEDVTLRVATLESELSGYDTLVTRVGALETSLGARASVPPGTMTAIHCSISSIPPGWVFCDGRTVTRTDGWIGVIPDRRDKFGKGATGDGDNGTQGGNNRLYVQTALGGAHGHAGSSVGSHVLTEAEMPSHRHFLEERKWSNTTDGGTGGWVGGQLYQSQHGVFSQYTGGGLGHDHPLYLTWDAGHQHVIDADNQPAFIQLIYCYKL